MDQPDTENNLAVTENWQEVLAGHHPDGAPGWIAPLLDSKSWVVAQLGQSLDGRIATESGHSHYINGAPALDHLHRLRALCDGVLVGVGTVLADNPQLTVRRVAGPQPARIILDPSGRMPDDVAALRDDGVRRIVIQKAARTRPAGIEILHLPDGTGRISPEAITQGLAEMGIGRVLVEGGAVTVSRFIEAGALDRLHLLVAPMILGSGRPGLQLPPIDKVDAALRPPTRSYPLGNGEILFDCQMRG
ncbi:RibD family protein [Lacibacterium aquatile]|uniref:RibD family protein n=1 Tax=Lacibacterium aquatile TaxID=1168082 RepID=A0ABW5DN69_9PROT